MTIPFSPNRIESTHTRLLIEICYVSVVIWGALSHRPYLRPECAHFQWPCHIKL